MNSLISNKLQACLQPFEYCISRTYRSLEFTRVSTRERDCPSLGRGCVWISSPARYLFSPDQSLSTGSRSLHEPLPVTVSAWALYPGYYSAGSAGRRPAAAAARQIPGDSDSPWHGDEEAVGFRQSTSSAEHIHGLTRAGHIMIRLSAKHMTILLSAEHITILLLVEHFMIRLSVEHFMIRL
jgi:hypothetical protein